MLHTEKYPIQLNRVTAEALAEVIEIWRNNLVHKLQVNRYEVQPAEYLSILPLERVQNRLQNKLFKTRHGKAKPFKINLQFDELIAANTFLLCSPENKLAVTALMEINQHACNLT